MNAHVKRIVGVSGVSSQCFLGEDRVGVVNLDDTMTELPGVGEGGMSGRNAQRKLGTTRRSLRLPHSEDIAYKPLRGEIAMYPRVGRMGSIKR